MTLANFNSNFNWQLRALQQAAECCGIVPSIPPAPVNEKCYCTTFFTKNVVGVIFQGITISGVNYPVNHDFFDPAFSSILEGVIIAAIGDPNIEVSLVQKSLENYELCIKNVDTAYIIEEASILDVLLSKKVTFIETNICDNVTRDPLIIVFNGDDLYTPGFPPASAMTLTDWNNYVEPLTNFTSFTYDPGTYTVQLYNGIPGTTLSAFNMAGYPAVISFYDGGGYFETIGPGVFNFCTSLYDVIFPACTTIDFNAFSFSFGLTVATIPNVGDIGSNAFESTNLNDANFPECIVVKPQAFQFIFSLATVNLPKCTDLGGSPGNDAVFFNTFGTISAVFNIALATIDGGNPDGDILELESNNGITATYVP